VRSNSWLMIWDLDAGKLPETELVFGPVIFALPPLEPILRRALP
jgi:hypothetical protein